MADTPHPRSPAVDTGVSAGIGCGLAKLLSQDADDPVLAADRPHCGMAEPDLDR